MINRFLFTHLPSFRKRLTRSSYEYVSFIDRDTRLHFLNYGYANSDSDRELPPLLAHERKQIYEVQLYDHVASMLPINWRGLKVLEVSCGRGGGAYYIRRRFQPAKVVGVDNCKRAIDFCLNQYALEGLSFIYGDAQELDFAANSFDVVINIEASFYYSEIERFFSSVNRILKPQGYFLYADMRYFDEIEQWRSQLHHAGLSLIKEEDITANVIRALTLDHKRRKWLVDNYVHRLLRPFYYRFAGATGGDLAHSSANARKRVYRCFAFSNEASLDYHHMAC